MNSSLFEFFLAFPLDTDCLTLIAMPSLFSRTFCCSYLFPLLTIFTNFAGTGRIFSRVLCKKRDSLQCVRDSEFPPKRFIGERSFCTDGEPFLCSLSAVCLDVCLAFFRDFHFRFLVSRSILGCLLLQPLFHLTNTKNTRTPCDVRRFESLAVEVRLKVGNRQL